MAKAGDIQFTTLKIGGIDVLNDVKFMGMNIYEDILSPITKAEVKIVDDNDTLGRNKINGKEDVEISFTTPKSSEKATYKLKLFKNADMNDGSVRSEGAMHSKSYIFKMVSPEMLTAQANYVQKSYNEQTSGIVKDIVKNYWKSDKEVDTPDETKGKQRYVVHNKHSFDVLKDLHGRHVSNKYESSAYVLFPTRENGKEKYKFCTFEHLMDQQEAVPYELTQDNTVGAFSTTEAKEYKNMLWCNVPESFNTLTRWSSASNRATYNTATGKMESKASKPTQFKKLGDDVYKNGPWEQTPEADRGNQSTIISPDNDKQKTYIADAKVKKAEFLAHLAQNYIEFEIPGNPAIKLGSVIKINIPKKSVAEQPSGETQMNDKVLVVAIRHKIKPPGSTPMYTMVVRAVKAAFKEGGQDG